jgi:hypothetical protein
VAEGDVFSKRQALREQDTEAAIGKEITFRESNPSNFEKSLPDSSCQANALNNA